MGRGAERWRRVSRVSGPRFRRMVHRCHRRLRWEEQDGVPAILPVLPENMSAYIELHTASAFSFLQGASLPEALVDRAADLGYSAIALLDRDGVYGTHRLHKAATAAGLRPIIGAELTIGAGGAGGAGEADREDSESPHQPY